MDVRIERREPTRVVALRHIGPFPLIGQKFGVLGQWAAENHVPVLGSLGVWYDDPLTVAESELRSDACLVVQSDYEVPTNSLGLRIDVVGGGEYATTSQFGPYDGLAAAWDSFCNDGLPSLGRKAAQAPSFEIYVNDCSKVKPEEVRTDLYVPLVPVE